MLELLKLLIKLYMISGGAVGVSDNLPSIVVAENGNVVVETVASKPVSLPQTRASEDAIVGIPSISALLRRDGQQAACKQCEDGNAAED